MFRFGELCLTRLRLRQVHVDLAAGTKLRVLEERNVGDRERLQARRQEGSRQEKSVQPGLVRSSVGGGARGRQGARDGG